jgi:CTP-dependent riboflavin kinase
MKREAYLLKQIELMKARRLHTGEKTEQGQWANTTEQSLAHAKKELEQIERLLSEAKTKTKIE